MTREATATFGGRKIDTSFNVYWMATFEDYDGAPDSSPCFRLMGTGRTEQEAVEHLIEQAELALDSYGDAFSGSPDQGCA